MCGAEFELRHKEPTMTSKTNTEARARPADIVREYGPFEGAERVHGVTHDGHNVWAATGARLIAFDPASGFAYKGVPIARNPPEIR